VTGEFNDRRPNCDSWKYKNCSGMFNNDHSLWNQALIRDRKACALTATTVHSVHDFGQSLLCWISRFSKIIRLIILLSFTRIYKQKFWGELYNFKYILGFNSKQFTWNITTMLCSYSNALPSFSPNLSPSYILYIYLRVIALPRLAQALCSLFFFYRFFLFSYCVL